MLNSWVRSLKVRNWKNIPKIEIDSLWDFSVIVWPNASGKSNFLDIILFLRDIAKNGLQQAVNQRWWIEKIRSLSAKNNTDISIEITVQVGTATWLYNLIINQGKRGLKGVSIDKTSRAYVKEESVFQNGNELFTRKILKDDSDLVTHMETPFKNWAFQELVNYFWEIDLLHIVPQMVKERQIKDTEKRELDIYGRNFIEKIWRFPNKRIREKYLNQIGKILRWAIPNFEELLLEPDVNSWVFHLVARFKNWRAPTAKQTELFLSDGTIRLIWIIWTLLAKKTGILLIDEPEVSLHTAIIRSLPKIIAQIQIESDIQVIVTTHSYEFISMDAWIKPKDIFIVSPDEKGISSVESLDKRVDAKNLLTSWFSYHETLSSITSSQTCLEL